MNALSTFAQILTVFKHNEVVICFPDFTNVSSSWHQLCLPNKFKWRFKEKPRSQITVKHFHYLKPKVRCNEGKPCLDHPTILQRAGESAGVPVGAASHEEDDSEKWQRFLLRRHCLCRSSSQKSNVGKAKLAAPLFIKHQQVPQTPQVHPQCAPACSHRLPGWGKTSFNYVSAFFGISYLNYAAL